MPRYEETLPSLNLDIDLNPGQPRPLAHRGETFRLMERYEEALADFDRAIALDPTYTWAIARRGETFRMMGHYEQALADFNQAIDLKPDYAWALAHRGVTYRRLERHREALADLNQAFELKPDYAWALLHRANACVAMRHYEAALADVDRVIALDGALIPYWQGERGLLLNYLGRYAETIECCQPALREDPGDYIALYSLAVAKARWRDQTEAQAVAHDPVSGSLAQMKAPADCHSERSEESRCRENETLRSAQGDKTEKAFIADIDRARAALLLAVNTETRAIVLYRLGGLAALESKVDQALDYLQEAISLHHEPVQLARHDPAWLDLRADPRFQALIFETTQACRDFGSLKDALPGNIRGNFRPSLLSKPSAETSEVLSPEVFAGAIKDDFTDS